MPVKTIEQLDEDIKASSVVYDHDFAKLVTKKTKVRRCRKEAFLSVLPYIRTSSCHWYADSKPPASSATTQQKCHAANGRAIRRTKQKLQFCVQTHLPLVPRTLSFELDPKTTISFLKGLIRRKFGVRPQNQRLHIRGNIQLCDLLTLHENGVGKDEIISLSTDDVTQDGPKETTTVDEDYICLLSSKIGSSWRKLAKHLGYKDKEIVEIQATIKVTSEASCQMLLTWWKKTRVQDEALHKLRQALTTIGLTDLAQNLPATSLSRDEIERPHPEQQDVQNPQKQKIQRGETTPKTQTLRKEAARERCDKQKLQIFVRNPLLRGPNTFCFQLEPGTAVSSLKELILCKTGVQLQHQCLYIRRNRRNVKLCGLLTLSDYGIEQDENILLRLSADGLRGGGPKDKDQLDDKLLQDLSSQVQEFWRELAEILGNEESEIKNVHELCENNKQRCHQMLLSWWCKQENSVAGFKKLREALRATGLSEQALLIPETCQEESLTTGSATSDESERLKQGHAGRLDTSEPKKQEDVEIPDKNTQQRTSWAEEALRQQRAGDLDRLQPKKQDNEGEEEQSNVKGTALLGEHQLRQQQVCDQDRIQALKPDTPGQTQKDYVHTSQAEIQQGERGREVSAWDQQIILNPSLVQDIVDSVNQQGTSSVISLVHGHGYTQPASVGAINVTGAHNPTFVGSTVNIVHNVTVQGSNPDQQCGEMQNRPRKHLRQRKTGKPELNNFYVLRLSKKISGDWEKLAGVLGFSKMRIMIFRYKSKNKVKQCSIMLGAWLKRQTKSKEATQLLGEALVRIGRSDLAVKLSERPLLGVKAVVKKKNTLDNALTKVLEDLIFSLMKNYGMENVEEKIGEILEKCQSSLYQVELGSVEFIIHAESRVGLECLWRMYTAGELAKNLTEIFITDELTTKDKTDLSIQVTLLESDYEDACRFFDELENAKDEVFPRMHIETDLLKNEMESSAMTILFRESVKDLLSTYGKVYVMHEFFAALKSWDLELKDVTYKSVVFVVRVKTRVGLEKLWAMYTTGELAKKLTEIFVTDDLTTEDKSDLSIQVTIPEKDYEQCCRFFGELDNATHEGNEQDASCKTTMQPNQDNSITTAGSDGHTEQATGRSAEKTNASHRTADGGHDINSKTDLLQQKQFGQISSEAMAPIGDPADHAADRCEEVLKTLYTTTGSYAPIIKWVGDKTKMVTPKLLAEKSGKSLLNFENIFGMKKQNGNPFEVVFLSGRDDEDRAFLLENITYDWATGSSPVLQQFKFVGALRMGPFHQESDLVGEIYDQLLSQHKSINKADLDSFFDANPQKVLVILHGLDEFLIEYPDKIRFDSILKILHRIQARGIQVLVSTNPSNCHKLVDRSPAQEPFLQLTVSGITEQEVEEYVRKFYQDEPPQAENLLGTIQSSERLCDLAKNLTMLLLLCFISKQSALPETMTRLYDMVLKYIFKGHSDLSQEDIFQVVKSLGKTALSSVVSPEKRFLFEEKEFEKKALDEALRVGLLTRQPVLKRQKSTDCSVQFTHKIFQDFCAAKHWQSMYVKDKLAFQEILDKLENPFAFEHMLRFCCGDNPSCAINVLDALCKNVYWRVRELALSCYFESQSSALLSVPCIESLITEDTLIYRRSNDFQFSFMWFLGHVSKHVSGWDYLAQIRELNVSYCNLSRYSDVFAFSLTKMKHLYSLTLRSCKMYGSNLYLLLSSVGTRDNLNEIDFSHSLISDCNAENWAPVLETIHLKSLVLRSCHLNPKDVSRISISAAKTASITYLNLSSNYKLGGTADEWAPQLQPLKNLQKLDLSGCNIEASDMQHILTGELKNLSSLELSNNPKLGGYGNVWAPQLRYLKSLETLDLSSCSISKQDMAYIASSVGDRDLLSDLDLSHNHDLGGHMEMWAACLKSMAHLKTLNMWGCNMGSHEVIYLWETISCMDSLIHFSSGNLELNVRPRDSRTELKIRECSLTGEVMADILQCLSNWRDLTSLTFSAIFGLSGCATAWAPHLQKLTHLEKLELQDCSLRSRDIEHLAVAVSHMPGLEELSLKGNQFLGGDAKTWAPQLQCLKSLNKLSLTSTALSEQDLIPIATSADKMDNLSDLDLSWNKDLGGHADKWAAGLKSMTNLKNLKVREHGLTSQDVKYLAEAISSMNGRIHFSSSNVELAVRLLENRTQLNIEDCSLTCEDLAEILQLLSNQRNFVVLDICTTLGLSGCLFVD